MITLEQYLMGRDKQYILPEDVKRNARMLLTVVNDLLTDIKFTLENVPGTDSPVASGWRPAEINARVPNAAAKSKHITGQAIDIYDPEGELDEWLMTYPFYLEKHGLYMEHPSATKNWCHLQYVSPKSGRRVFYP